MSSLLRYDCSGVSLADLGITDSQRQEVDARLLTAREQVVSDDLVLLEKGEIPAQQQPLDAAFFRLPEELLADYEQRQQASQLGCILQTANRLRETVDAVALLGIGGSYMGTRALMEACCPAYYNELSRQQRNGCPRLYFGGNSLDNDATSALINRLGDGQLAASVEERWAIVVISKSGATLETATALRQLLPYLQSSCGDHPGQVAERVVPVTGNAGRLGERWDAWHIDIAAKCRLGNGACPECFRFDGSDFQHGSEGVFELPMLELPEGGEDRLRGRIDLLGEIQQQQRVLERAGDEFDSSRRQAISVLADEKVTNAFNVEKADQKLRERYGDNKFGLSLLMARRLVESGVNLVQVNLGKNSSWDTHLNNFITLKNNLLPPMDRAVSALLDDLGESGLLDETLVIMTGEFGRTPKINKRAGRDHWGPVNTVMFFGGGVQGGNIIGASDRTGSEPTRDIQLPENFAATIYEALGIPRTGIWRDVDGRPHRIYGGKVIPGLYS